MNPLIGWPNLGIYIENISPTATITKKRDSNQISKHDFLIRSFISFLFFFPLVFLRIRSAMIGLVHSSLFNSFPSIQYDRLHRIIQAQVKVQHIQYTPVWLVSAQIEPRLKNLMVHINTADLSQKKKNEERNIYSSSSSPKKVNK